MAKKESYVVIGLGKFGMTICRHLAKAGQEVLAIDNDPEVINEAANIVMRAVVANAEDEEALLDLAVGSFDHVYISIGQNIEASIMATLLIKEQGGKDVTCRAENIHHARVLEKIGADHVVRPEHDTAERLIFNQLNRSVLDYVYINDHMMLAEVTIRNPKFINQTLEKLNLRQRFGVNVLAIIEANDEVNEMPQATDIICENDKLTIVGTKESIQRLSDEVDV
ncbi:potassium channel family protein [Limosilactobacillus equigenerosi]|uniref:Potassium transporter n=1 Tax=Limosilactobacillus equigenerosi DSM 18793 = JCM 14505 TaxID=1423742 RepID=A0A0R1UI65_9LACO|nr:TrkA family potassium uptake protein [Limosilactobacillus equigenerosi]KRL92973.1 Potassium transporter [Limosilactobacillus equigenerosi DSM 18793 = JCM 14505]